MDARGKLGECARSVRVAEELEDSDELLSDATSKLHDALSASL